MNIFINTQTARELGLPGRHLVGAEYELPMGKLCSILRFSPLEERFLRAHPFPLTLVATEREGYYRIHVKPAEGATSVPLALATGDVANNPFANSSQTFHDLNAAHTALNSQPSNHLFPAIATASGPEPGFQTLTPAISGSNVFIEPVAVLTAAAAAAAAAASSASVSSESVMHDSNRGNSSTTRVSNGIVSKSKKRSAPVTHDSSTQPGFAMHSDSSSPTTDSSTISSLSSSSSSSTGTMSASSSSSTIASSSTSTSSSSSSSPHADGTSSAPGSGRAVKVRKVGRVTAMKSEESDDYEDESDEEDMKSHEADGDHAVDDGDVVQRKKALKKMYKQRYQQKKSIKRKLKRFHETTSDCAVVIFVTRNSQRKFGCDIEFFSPAQENGHFFNLWWAEHQQTLYSYIQAYYQSPNGNTPNQSTPAQEAAESAEAANTLEAVQTAAAAAALAQHPYVLHQQHAHLMGLTHMQQNAHMHSAAPFHSSPFAMSHPNHQNVGNSSSTITNSRPVPLQGYLQSSSAPMSAYHSPHQPHTTLQQSGSSNSNLRNSASYSSTALNSPHAYPGPIFFPGTTQSAISNSKAATALTMSSSTSSATPSTSATPTLAARARSVTHAR